MMRRLVSNAKAIIKYNTKPVTAIAQELLEKKRLSAEEVKAIARRFKVRIATVV